MILNSTTSLLFIHDLNALFYKKIFSLNYSIHNLLSN